MSATKLSKGTVHAIPVDLKRALLANTKAHAAWEDITPLARNEWICWAISVKTSETRVKHIERVATELSEGIRRPCCWYGCIHRTDKAISPSVQNVVLNRQR